MARSNYAAGFRFIAIGTPNSSRAYDREAVKSHATKAGRRTRKSPKLRSWITPGRELESFQGNRLQTSCISGAVPLGTFPGRIGGAFSGIQLPGGVEAYMIQDLVRLIVINKHGRYPHEICLEVHVTERGWFPYLISDICCLHSLMFSARAWEDGVSHDQLSRSSYFHYVQTLRLLQARLYDIDHTAAISDSKIMVITTLAAVAELTEDFESLANHVKGLEKIVDLRGGLQAMNTHNNMQIKVCRTDIAYALLSGHQPLLFKENIQWKCFIADHDIIQCSHQPHDAIFHSFVENQTCTRLGNMLKDVHTFSSISNLAYQTTRKLSPETYNEMMVSIFYRLTHLFFDTDPIQEACRLGLLVFASTIFLRGQFMPQRYDNLLSLFSRALLRLRDTTDLGIPMPVLLWLIMVSHVVRNNERPLENWQRVWLYETLACAGVNSWSEASEILRSMAWIDFIHARLGKDAFEMALHQRSGTAQQ